MTVGFRFSEQELYELWAVFRDNPDAVQMLSDLIGRGNNPEQARKLIKQFEIRHETAILDACRRGKEGRYRRNI